MRKVEAGPRWKNTKRGRILTVRALSPAATRGVLRIGGMVLSCALGRGGRRPSKREGDGATPIGKHPVGEVFYRADRMRRPRTCLSAHPLHRWDGWCDDPADRNYNRPVRHPYPASAEVMWRRDDLYDVVIVLDYNQRPRIRGRGSAVFMHLARPGYAPTAGCIALSAHDMRIVLECLAPAAVVHVVA